MFNRVDSQQMRASPIWNILHRLLTRYSIVHPSKHTTKYSTHSRVKPRMLLLLDLRTLPP